MNKYESLYEIIQESLDNGDISLEEAEVLNEYAYDKYVEEKTALQKRVEDDLKYDELRNDVKAKMANEEDSNKLRRLLEIDNNIYAKKLRSDNGRIISAKKKLGFDTNKDEKNAKNEKEKYDIKPQKERKPNTYYDKQKDKNKFNELVKKYNYDPKSKTIEIDGTKTPIRYIHDGNGSQYEGISNGLKHKLKKVKKEINALQKIKKTGVEKSDLQKK